MARVARRLLQQSTSASLSTVAQLEVSINRETEMLEVANLVKEGQVSRYPFVWLRDNCICTSCFHPKSSSRLTSFAGLQMDDAILSAHVTENAVVQDTRLGRTAEGGAAATLAPTKSLQLHWSSGHESTFPLDWLKERCFSGARQAVRSSEMDPFSLLEALGWKTGCNDVSVRATHVPIPGARELQAREIPRFDFEALVDQNQPSQILGWCHALEKYGECSMRPCWGWMLG